MGTTALDTTAVLESLLKINKAYWNLRSGVLIEHAIRVGEGHLADNGALAAYTSKYTGRLPNDKTTTKDSTAADKVDWSETNLPLDAEEIGALLEQVIEYVRGRELDAQDRRLERQRAVHKMHIQRFLIQYVCVSLACTGFAALGLFYLQGFHPFGFALDTSLMHWIGSATIGAIGGATTIVYRAVFRTEPSGQMGE